MFTIPLLIDTIQTAATTEYLVFTDGIEDVRTSATTLQFCRRFSKKLPCVNVKRVIQCLRAPFIGRSTFSGVVENPDCNSVRERKVCKGTLEHCLDCRLEFLLKSFDWRTLSQTSALTVLRLPTKSVSADSQRPISTFGAKESGTASWYAAPVAKIVTSATRSIHCPSDS